MTTIQARMDGPDGPQYVVTGDGPITNPEVLAQDGADQPEPEAG
jgi:hypothetical protein